MDKATLAISEQIEAVEAQIKNLGPLLWGTLKKNRVRRERKDGSVHVSKTCHTFCYRDADGRPAWKRVQERSLPEVVRRIKAGRAYKELRDRHARLLTAHGMLRKAGLHIGTGHMEATIRVLIVRCLKQAGMHWRHANIIHVAALHAQYRSRKTA